MDNTPIDPGNDDWYRAVPVFTGYTPPSITDVLENLKSYDGTPLMHVTIKKADNNDLPELEETNWQEQNFYNEIGAMNFNVPFYLYGGRDPKKYVANIQLIGIQDTKTAINSGGSAGSFKSEGANAQESKWDTTKLAQYSYGTGAALDWLLTKPHGTRGFDWSPAVTDETYVDPSTFEKTALAFDRFRHFVGQRKDVAESWKKTFGETEDEKWKGQAAGVWWNLTHLIIRRYERLSEDMTDVADRSVGLHGITGSRQASAIRYAGLSFLDEAEKLHDAWSDWLGYEKYDGSFNPSPNCNPLFYLTRILNQVMNNIWYDNIFKVNYVGDPVYDDSSGYTSLSSGYNPGVDRGPQMQYGFTSVARDDDCSYGELDNPETWKAIGQEAVERWWRDIRKQLGEPGEAARKRLRSAFGDATGDVGEIRAAGGQDLTQSLQQDQADRDKKVAADEKAKQEQLSKDTQEKYDKQREDDLARANAEQDRQEKLRKEQEAKAQKQRQEDLASQKAEQGRQDQIRKAQEAKADEQRAEDLGRQTRMEHEQKEKEKEQEAQQQEQQRRQEQEQHRQEAEQEAKEKQQEAKQDRIRAEQEAKQEEAQRRQEQQQSQQMIQQRIMQERERKEQKEREREQQRRQDEQEQRQEELQREQEAKQEQQQRHQEQREDAQQRRQEELQKEQEQRQEELQREQEAKQEQQQRHQEQREDAQQRRQEELQKEQEQRQEELQKRQQAYQDRAGDILGDQRGESSYGQYQGGPSDDVTGPVNGDDSLTNPGGSHSHLDSHGRVVTDYPDGSRTTIDPQTQTSTLTEPDGSFHSGPLNAGDIVTNHDGSVSYLDSQGQVETEYPDGSRTTVDPRTGATTLTSPDGTTTSGYLHGGSAPVTNFGSNGLTTGPDHEYELYDPQSVGGSGGQNDSASAASSLGAPGGQGGYPGGMPMGGMGGMGGGGGQGQGGTSERTRNVIDGGGVISNRRRPVAARATGSYDEREARVNTTGGSPYGPGSGGNGGQGQQQTQSGDRERESWVEESEDVWGSDEGSSPAVIGR